MLLCLCLAFGPMGCSDDDGPGDNANQNDNQNDNANQNDNQNNNNVTITPFTGTLDELDGYYEITELAIKPSVVEVVMTREKSSVNLPELGGTQAMCRGYGDLVSSSAAAGQMDLRWGIIAEAFQYGDVGYYVQRDDWTLTWEQADGKLVMEAGGDQAVYLAEFESEVLTLHYDDTDTRNDFTDMPARFVLTRTAPPTSILEGTWTLEYATHNLGEADEYTRYSECHPQDPDDPRDGEYGFDLESFIFTAGGWLELDGVAETWDSSDCTGDSVYYSHGSTYGFFELDETNGRLDYNFYIVDGYLNEHGIAYGYTLDATSMTLTFIEYRNILASPGEFPDVVVYVKQP